jgi:hypothetical protein
MAYMNILITLNRRKIRRCMKGIHDAVAERGV